MKTIATCIMYYHARPHPRELLAALPTAKLVIDEIGNGAWHTARRAWLVGAVDTAASHVLVVHDDAQPSPGVWQSVQAAVATYPDQIVSFYSSLPQYTEHVARGATPHFIATAKGCCGLALCMPVQKAIEFVAWCDTHIQAEWRADDARVALYAAAHGERIFHTNPALFQHPPLGQGVDGGANKFAPSVARGAILSWSPHLTVTSGEARDQRLYLRIKRNKFNKESPHGRASRNAKEQT